MTTPANPTERHYAEQALLAAVVAERQASADLDGSFAGPTWDAWKRASRALVDASQRYYEAVRVTGREADPIIENIAEAGTFEVHDCPGGAYVITETVGDDEVEVPDLLAALQASIDRHKASRSAAIGPARFDPDMPDVDPADRYDSGYIAHPAEADGRAADEFYGRDN